MDVLLNNHSLVWFAIAGLSFILELSVMGLGGPLLFFAIASTITGICVSVGLVTTWPFEILLVGLLTAVVTSLLWIPLKRMQNKTTATDESSDMIGLRVLINEDITESSGTIRYSGINWNARLAKGESTIKTDQFCVINAIDGTTLIVSKIN